MKIPPPPVPARLREILKDYPELIQALQDRLDDLVNETKGGTSIPPFELAVWALEDRLSSFLSRARSELEVAKAGGDPRAIERAKEKVGLMLDASSPNMGLKNLDELGDYFDTHARAFQ